MSPVVRFVGIYNADGGLAGELRYVYAKLSGSASCALCDITHGTKLRSKEAWRTCKTALPVPIETLHRNERDQKLTALTEGLLPCVVAFHVDGAARIAVTADELDTCNEDVSALEALLQRFL